MAEFFEALRAMGITIIVFGVLFAIAVAAYMSGDD